MATALNVTWVQGQDLDFALRYKEGADANSLVVKDLTTGYDIRMDIVDANGVRLYTFNSSDIPDVDPITVGDTPDDTTEAVLSSGTESTPNVDISVSRALTLPGGALYTGITASPPVLTYLSDVFLRDTVANKQWKIATLTIAIEKSYTLWP
jgi:hypothetical protein